MQLPTKFSINGHANFALIYKYKQLIQIHIGNI